MPRSPKKLVTAALPYANGPLHLGHILEQIQADIWVRAHKMLGEDVIFICGDDAHGTAIMLHAEKQGITPSLLIHKIYDTHVADLKDFYIDHDNFSPPHSPENQSLVNTIYSSLEKNNDILKKTIQQAYDPIKALFLPDRFIKGSCPRCKAPDQYGDNCEQCGATYSPNELINPVSVLTQTPPEWRDSEHYFFNLPRYAEFLKTWTQQGTLQPAIVNKLKEWLNVELTTWDISRDQPYFGFEIPNAPGKYFYVWLDAPIGYIASVKNLCARNPELDFDALWKTDKTALFHFIGKDVVYFHALFWPALLKSANLRLPTSIFTHGFITVNGEKMSKSRGTFLNARTYLNHLNPEYLRYYFAAKLSPTAEDIDLNLTDFMQRVNSDLIGKVINIASRCSMFIEKYFNLTLSATNPDPKRWKQLVSAGDIIIQYYEQLEYSKAVREIMALADQANQYIDQQKPWALIKDPAQLNTVHAVCSFSLNIFKLLMTYLKPILPVLATNTEKFLNIKSLNFENRDIYLLNHVINPYQPLLNRIDPTRLTAMTDEARSEIPLPATPSLELKPEINFTDFDKIDLRIAKIIDAEAVPDADKLLKLIVDLGGEKRQIFAGIKSAYTPEQLIGRLTVIVANLAPRKMRFGVSEGMVLAAGPGGTDIWILNPDAGAQPGMKVK